MSSSGGRPQSVSDDEIIRYLRESDERVLTTPEVAEALDVSRRTAHRRLSALADDGRIERKDIGQRSSVWWVEGIEKADSPAAPLRRLVGGLDAEAAEEARKRSQEWRDEFDSEITSDGS